MDVQLPDGTVLKGVPDGTTKAQIAGKLKAGGREVPDDWLPKEETKTPDKSFGEKAIDTAKYVGNEAARVGIKAITDVPLAFADAGVAIANKVQGKPNDNLPSQKYEKGLDANFPPPTTTAGKVSEGVSELLAGGVGSAARRGAGLLTKGEAALSASTKVKDAEKAAVKATEMAPDNAKLANAQKWGFKVLPSQGGAGIKGKMAQGYAGEQATEASLSKANAVTADRLAAKAIGLPDKAMTEGNIERLKQGAYKVYDRVKTQGKIVTDDAYRAELESVKDRTGQAAHDFPEDFNERIDKEIAKFNRPSADSASFLEKIKSLRQRAGKNMSSLNADDFELGVAQKKIATAMENQIERHVAASDPKLIEDFRKARTQLAKIYNVEDALSPSGHISAAVLSRQLKKGVPLSDELKAIAENYQEFPKNMRHPDAVSGKDTPFSRLDYLVGGVAAMAHPAKAAEIAGALVARPISKAVIKSKTYQKSLKGFHDKPRSNTLGDLATGAAVASPTLQDQQ